MPMPQLIPILFDDNDRADSARQPTVNGEPNRDVLDLTVLAGGAGDDAEPAESVKRLSPEEEVQLWLDSFALAFGLDDGRKRRRWIDV